MRGDRDRAFLKTTPPFVQIRAVLDRALDLRGVVGSGSAGMIAAAAAARPSLSLAHPPAPGRSLPGMHASFFGGEAGDLTARACVKGSKHALRKFKRHIITVYIFHTLLNTFSNS